MDARVETKSRLSRWSRGPVLDNAGRPRFAQITERDIEIFKLLSRYSYLPIDDIHAHVGGSLDGLAAHMNLLCRRPNLFLNRPHQQRLADANYRRMIYELDDKGRQALADRALPHLPKRYHRNFAHELLACRIMFSFELGVRGTPHMRLIQWSEIVQRMPPQASDDWTAIPVTFISHGKPHSKSIKADWRPFGIERREAARSLFCFFPGIEADTGTEPIESAEFRSDISQKFNAYLAVCKERIYQSHFGFPAQGFFIPFITGSKVRMEHMMELLRKLTDGRGHPSFIFKWFPPITSFEKPPAPSGRMVTEPWLRVGAAPLLLSGS
jgi:Replication-relaxation